VHTHIATRTIGFFSALLGVLFLIVARATAGSLHDVSAGWPFGLPFTVVGVFAVLGIRLAGLLLSLSYAAVSASMCIGSIGNVPMPYILINEAFGIGMLLPLIAIIYYDFIHNSRHRA
jgi:hypothetical protein